MHLFITEGNADDKLNAILANDYLAFAYRQFECNDGPLVVFGHSLSESDRHIVRAMKEWGHRRIAVGIRSRDAAEIVARKVDLRKLLPQAELMFFDSSTHPLGSDDLLVDPM